MPDLPRAARPGRALLVTSFALSACLATAAPATAADGPSPTPATATVGLSPAPAAPPARPGAAPARPTQATSGAASSAAPAGTAASASPQAPAADSSLGAVEGVTEERRGMSASALLPWLVAALSVALTGAGLRRLLAADGA